METISRFLRSKSSTDEKSNSHHSFALFQKLRDASISHQEMTNKFVGNERKLVTSEGIGNSTEKEMMFSVSHMKILPSVSDMQMVTTDSELLEEEERLYRFASLSDGDTKLEDMNNNVEEIRKEEKKVNKNVEALLNKMEEQSEDEKMIRKELLNKMEQQSDELKELKLHQNDELKVLKLELMLVTATCVTIGIAALVHLKRG